MDMRKSAYSQEYKLSPIEQAHRSHSYDDGRSQHSGTYTVGNESMYDPDRVVQEFGMQVGEAADMYGDLDTAEDYGYVTRG